jgi:DNA-binding NtrC family response regulator
VTKNEASTALLVAGATSSSELEAVLRDVGFEPVRLGTKAVLAGLRERFALCLVDLCENGDAMRIARLVRTEHPNAVLIGVADPARPGAAADAIRAGVFDVLPRPPSSRDLQALLANAREQAGLAGTAQPPRAADPLPYGIIGSSPGMRLVLDLVQRAASARCGITLFGERGTGREMIARAIHAYSPARRAPFVKVDCSGPTPEDIELQLFGAVTRRAGTASAERRSLERVGQHSRLGEAAGGILFLENVPDMPARLQARLLRVLRDREAFVENGRDPVDLNIRPIAAVDASVNAALDEGRLRPDLYERLSLIRIDVPALRQRREDIPILASHFLKELCRANGKPMKTLTRSALTLLSALPWRGNTPELKALLERLVLLVPNGLIRLEDVLAHTELEGTASPFGVEATLRQVRARFERDYIAAVLQHHHGRIADAARVLGIQRTNLYRKMRRLNMMRTKRGR